MLNITQLDPGTQIAYIPNHAEGDISHPDVEFGFITSVRSNAAFCRYWRKGHPGELRTTSCSELTPLANIRVYESVSKDVVERAMEWIK